MRVAIGSDHAGFELKEAVKTFLAAEHLEVVDVGTYSQDPVDYPDYAQAVAAAVRESRAERGILLCGSGVGASMVANRIPGIRAGRASCTRPGRPSRVGRTRVWSCRSRAMMPSMCPCRDRNIRSAWSRRRIDSDKVNLVGITNQDVAYASAAGINVARSLLLEGKAVWTGVDGYFVDGEMAGEISWRRAARAAAVFSLPVFVDLADCSRVDDAGHYLLALLHLNGTHRVASRVATTGLVESLAREWPVPTSTEEGMAPCAMFNQATGQEQGKEIKE
jgi:Ribose/Galactose Isomerase